MTDGDESRVAALLAAMDRFARGEDCSHAASNAIEGEIELLFDEDDQLEELAEFLAQYRPEGGDHLYSKAQALPVMSRWCEVLRGRMSGGPPAQHPA